MLLTIEKVKQALIEVAKKRNRPVFDMGTVKDVAQAIKENTDHRLKTATLQELFLIYSREYNGNNKPTEAQATEVIDKIKIIKSYYSGQKQLLVGTKVSERTIAGLLSGDRVLTRRIYERLMPFMDELISKLQKDSRPRLDPIHGLKNTYSKHKCRCDLCKKAWMSYAKERKKIKQLNEVGSKNQN